MLKTAQQVEEDFYMMIKGSALGAAIRGSIYRKGMRPDNASTEDIVVAFLSGTDKQLQRGVVVVRTYVPDILSGERMVQDMERIGRLEQLVQQFIDDNRTEYWIETETTPVAVHLEQQDQHCLITRFAFDRMAS